MTQTMNEHVYDDFKTKKEKKPKKEKKDKK